MGEEGGGKGVKERDGEMRERGGRRKKNREKVGTGARRKNRGLGGGVGKG